MCSLNPVLQECAWWLGGGGGGEAVGPAGRCLQGVEEKEHRYVGTTMREELSAPGLHPMRDGEPQKEFQE